MKEFGADAAWSSKSSITVRPGKYRDIPFTVESDWSGASYWYQMVALIQDNEKRNLQNGNKITRTSPTQLSGR